MISPNPVMRSLPNAKSQLHSRSQEELNPYPRIPILTQRQPRKSYHFRSFAVSLDLPCLCAVTDWSKQTGGHPDHIQFSTLGPGTRWYFWREGLRKVLSIYCCHESKWDKKELHFHINPSHVPTCLPAQPFVRVFPPQLPIYVY